MPQRSRVQRKFSYAWRGLTYILRRELSFRLELGAVGLGVLAGWLVHFSALAWGLFVLTAAVVLAFEIANTVLERLLDLISPKLSVHVALLKDLLAAAVLLLVLAAAAIALALLYSSAWF